MHTVVQQLYPGRPVDFDKSVLSTFCWYVAWFLLTVTVCVAFFVMASTHF